MMSWRATLELLVKQMQGTKGESVFWFGGVGGWVGGGDQGGSNALL